MFVLFGAMIMFTGNYINIRAEQKRSWRNRGYRCLQDLSSRLRKFPMKNRIPSCCLWRGECGREIHRAGSSAFYTPLSLTVETSFPLLGSMPTHYISVIHGETGIPVREIKKFRILRADVSVSTKRIFCNTLNAVRVLRSPSSACYTCLLQHWCEANWR
jgi:hypothetical protein